MIRNRSRRMTVAQLKERMDTRFKAVDKRFDAADSRLERLDSHLERLDGKMDAGFNSVHDKLNAILRALQATDDYQQQILDEHENRLRDLEASRPARPDTAR
jgi:chromosome segregation ATPase